MSNVFFTRVEVLTLGSSEIKKNQQKIQKRDSKQLSADPMNDDEISDRSGRADLSPYTQNHKRL